MLATITINELLQPAPRVYASQSCRETEQIILANPESECVVVCDKADRPVGLVMCGRFFLKLNTAFGFGHYYHGSIVNLMNRSPFIIDVDSPAERLQSAITSRPPYHRNDCVIVTAHDKLSGILRASDLARISPFYSYNSAKKSPDHP